MSDIVNFPQQPPALAPDRHGRAHAVERGGAAFRSAPPLRLCTICGEHEPHEGLTLCRHCLYAA